MEPDLRYHLRKKSARYHSYTGPIINLYASWLFLSGFEVKAYKAGSNEPAPVDKWYTTFQENVGSETTLKAFMKDRFREAMTVGKSIWLAELPRGPEDMSALSRADYDKLGLGNATLNRIDPNELIDWCCDDVGNLIWAIVKTTRQERTDWRTGRGVIVDEWRVYEATTVSIFEHRRDADDPADDEDELKPLGVVTHGFKRIPITVLEIPREMCIGEQTYDAQLSHFELDCALTWAIKLCCYPMPVYHVEDPGNVVRQRTGAGYAQFIGIEEKLEYTSPPSDSFDVVVRARDSKRDEIFRIVHQLAQGMDNNAETVGRSADSKAIDAAATRIMLHAYGEIVGRSIEATFELVAEARQDADCMWVVDGFTGYDTTTVASLISAIESAKKIGIPSMTFQREVAKKAAVSLLPDAGAHVKTKIRAEIDKFTFNLTGDVLELDIAEAKAESVQALAETNNASAEGMQVKDLKSKEKTAKMTAKAAKAAKSAKPVGGSGKA